MGERISPRAFGSQGEGHLIYSGVSGRFPEGVVRKGTIGWGMAELGSSLDTA